MQNLLNLRSILPKLYRKFSQPKRNARFVHFAFEEFVWNLAPKSKD